MNAPPGRRRSAGLPADLRGPRGPAWRWWLATLPPSAAARRFVRRYGPTAGRARAYVAARRDPALRASAAANFPDLHAAAAYENDAELAGRLRVLALRLLPPDEIAAELGLDADAVGAWVELFFDVGPAIDADGWVGRWVTRPETSSGDAELAAELRAAAAEGAAAARRRRAVAAGPPPAGTGSEGRSRPPDGPGDRIGPAAREEPPGATAAEPGRAPPAPDLDHPASPPPDPNPRSTAMSSEAPANSPRGEPRSRSNGDPKNDPTGAPPLRTLVYERFLESCVPFPGDPPWSGFGEQRGAFFTPSEPGPAVARLVEEFGVDACVAAGIAERPGPGTMVPAAAVAAPGEVLIALGPAAGGRPFEILADHGTLSGETTAAEAAWRELRAAGSPPLPSVDGDGPDAAGGDGPDAAGGDGPDAAGGDAEPWERAGELLFLTCSVRDAAALRSSGLAAAPAADLAGLRRGRLEAFRRAFAEESDPFSPPPSLVAVAWAPAGFSAEPPPGLNTLRERYVALAAHYPGQLPDVGVWRPTAEEIDRIRFAFENFTPAVALRLVRRSVEASREGLAESPRSLARVFRPDGDFADAVDELARVRRDGGDACLRRQARKNFDLALHRDVYAPLVRSAAGCDPVERHLRLALADVGRAFLRQADRVEEGWGPSPPGERRPPQGPAAADEIRTLLRLGREVRELALPLLPGRQDARREAFASDRQPRGAVIEVRASVPSPVPPNLGSSTCSTTSD